MLIVVDANYFTGLLSRVPSSAVKKAERLLKNMFITENTVEKRVFSAAGQKNFDSHLSQHSSSLSISRQPVDNRFRLPKTTENLSPETWVPNYSSVAHTKCFRCCKKRAEHENQLRMFTKKAFASGSHYDQKNENFSQIISWHRKKTRPDVNKAAAFILCGDVLISNPIMRCLVRPHPNCATLSTLCRRFSSGFGFEHSSLFHCLVELFTRVKVASESTWGEFRRLWVSSTLWEVSEPFRYGRFRLSW